MSETYVDWSKIDPKINGKQIKPNTKKVLQLLKRYQHLKNW